MYYEKSERVQHTSYCCINHFILDVLETLLDEDMNNESVHIIADKFLVEKLIKVICQANIDDFEFNLALVDFYRFDDTIDEYRITIFTDGEVYVESAINKNANYYDCDGFIFAECEVSDDVYMGNNKHCDVMVFDICDL